MLVYLFRHGETAGNAAGKYLGITDEPLSPQGLEKARSAGSDTKVDTVVVSPLQRTQMTASILFPQAQQLVCRGLKEMDFGDFEDRSAKEMEHDPDYRYWVEQTQCMGPCPHGDATMVFQHRVWGAFQREVERALDDGRDSLYFVVHGGVVMSVLYRFGVPKAPFYSWPLKTCEGYRCRVEYGPEGLQLVDICHLDGVKP